MTNAIPTIGETGPLFIELIQRAHEADRQPVCFTIGPDFEVIIKSQMALNAPAIAQRLEKEGFETLLINNLPVRRMPSEGIALHTTEITVALDHTPS